jgi:hypothetical protein
MPVYYQLTPFVPQFAGSSGAPLSNGTLNVYLAGTTTPSTLYTDDVGTATGAVITLNTRGYPSISGNTVLLYALAGVEYKIVLKDRTGAIIYTIDDVSIDSGLRTDLAAPTGTDLVTYGTRTLTSRLNDALNIVDFGAVGDGIANDTAAWLAFKSACTTQGKRGYLPAGIYLIDPFTFGSSDWGLNIEGPSGNLSSPTPGPGPGFNGSPVAILRLRSAADRFVSFDGVYHLEIKNVLFDGNQFANNVFYWVGVNNNLFCTFRHCAFYGSTPTTGVVHRYAGTLGGDHIYYEKCWVCQNHGASGTARAGFLIKVSNSNAFLIEYKDCFLYEAIIGVEYANGSCNLIGCQMEKITNYGIQIVNICQPFICSNFYTEGMTVPVVYQVLTAGVTADRTLTFINPVFGTTATTAMILNCQQQVHILGGYFGGNIDVSPVATYGLNHILIDGAEFASGRGITGTGALTSVDSRNISAANVYTAANTSTLSNLRGIRNYKEYRMEISATSANGGAVIDVTGVQFIVVSNAAPQNVTFLTGDNGQMVTIYFSGANTTLVHSATFALSGSINVTPTSGSLITFMKVNSNVWSEVSRSIK